MTRTSSYNKTHYDSNHNIVSVIVSKLNTDLLGLTSCIKSLQQHISFHGIFGTEVAFIVIVVILESLDLQALKYLENFSRGLSYLHLPLFPMSRFWPGGTTSSYLGVSVWRRLHRKTFKLHVAV